MAAPTSKQKTFVIRHQKSSLTLEEQNRCVTLQHFTGFSHQLWYLEPGDNGKSYIVNKGSGKVLEIEGGIKSGAAIICGERQNRESQQWALQLDGTIISSRGNLAVDIFSFNEEAGARLIAYPHHGKTNQVFQVQYK